LQLADVELPFEGRVACKFEIPDDFSVRVHIEAFREGEKHPAFVDLGRNARRIFFLTGLFTVNESAERNMVSEFSNVAPLMMFLRYAAGKRAWHAVGQYANLTVDDPWLTQPYGNLDYAMLLKEMSKHTFHTTIALIPWNFDRSNPEATSLFRSNPDRFSIAIHGNNHNHREFGPYVQSPFDQQAANLKQALARMEQFSHSTGIRYDPVMIFPHAVAPEGTFRMMKAYNYWATANSANVPVGSNPPDDPIFWMRPQTLAFSNILSIKRHSAEAAPISPRMIAINAYLENPLLFYVHQQFFSTGSGAFNRVADSVNRIAPKTQWCSLGKIVQHLYFLRLRHDRNYDVRALSPNFYLSNPESRDVVFHVRKAESFNPHLRSLSADGKSLTYQALANEMTFDVQIPAGQTRHIEIVYENDLDLAHTAVSKTNTVVNILRYLSDFRDIVLSKSDTGRTLTAVYYWYRAEIAGSNAMRLTLLLLVATLACMLARLLYRIRKQFLLRCIGDAPPSH
jgi:hypothetical protein